MKPSNTLLDADGSLFVANFGLAKRVDTHTDASLTEEGVFVGTPHYIAPEVVGGEKADHRGDIYALGITLFELSGFDERMRLFEVEWSSSEVVQKLED